MAKISQAANVADFHPLKIIKKEKLAKNIFGLEFFVPNDLAELYRYRAGQYVTLRIQESQRVILRDFSLTAAPYEAKIAVAVKINAAESAAQNLFNNYQAGDFIKVSLPKGRFTLAEKPHEFRTIVCFAGGIGITPIISHIKNLLYTEPRTRIFLFFGNKSIDDVPFMDELAALAEKYGRLQTFYFYSGYFPGNSFYHGRIGAEKLRLIINQILHTDDTDEESTLWDAVDKVLICGPGDMIRDIANACVAEGIPKKNILFELFGAYNKDIYPPEKAVAPLEDIKVDFKYSGKSVTAYVPDNSANILQSLLNLGFNVPYSCKSGICGSCICKLDGGEATLLENEYLTPSEEKAGYILACMSLIASREISINFDAV